MKRFRHLLCVAAMLLAGLASAQTPPAEARKADHDALRALLSRSAEALNARNLDAVAPLLHPALTVITVDNQKLVGLDAAKKYYAALFDGPDAVLSKMEVQPVADELTQFISPTSGVVYGVSDDRYTFTDGDVRTMKTRWSAVVQKEGNDWKLVNVHFSSNLLDNPMLDAAQAYVKKTATFAGLIGLIVGGLFVLLIQRRTHLP